MSMPMSADDLSPAARRGGRKRLRWLGYGTLLLLLLASGPVCKFLYDRHKAQKELQAVIKDLDDNDPGWRLEEIEAALPDLPDDQNGALVVAAAVERLPENWIDGKLFSKLDKLEPREELTEEQRTALAQALRGVEPALVEARRLRTFSSGRHKYVWTRDIIGTKMKNLLDAQDVTRLLRMGALWFSVQRDETQAWECSYAAFNASCATGEPIGLLSLLMRLRTLGDALWSMERTLANGQVSVRALADTQHRLENEADQPLLRTAFRGERAMYDRLFSNMETGVLALEDVDRKGNASFWERAHGRVARDVIVPPNHKWYLRFMSDVLDALALPPQELNLRLDQLDAQAKNGPFLAVLFTPACQKVAANYYRTQARLQCTIVGLAMERYRMKQDRWPNQLADLVPQYLAQVPTDPFDGKPLRFRQQVDHVVIYSVGPDGVDDGGNVSNADRAPAGTDIGFRLWNSDQRRRPGSKD
jgi:hypothetical protein